MSCECACHGLGVAAIDAECPCHRFETAHFFETNSYTVVGEVATLVDEIAVWDPETVIKVMRLEDPASP